MIKIKVNETLLKTFSQTFKTTIPFLRNVYENKNFCPLPLPHRGENSYGG
jgi:hypothetical protein